jgi:hypothetical protein
MLLLKSMHLLTEVGEDIGSVDGELPVLLFVVLGLLKGGA